MKTIYTMIIGALFACSSICPGSQANTSALNVEKKPADIQLAILLDVSGSMDGLIDQARAHLWKIVNELTLARKDGGLPGIEIALYSYGNSERGNDYIKQILPLTDDLDGLSEALFKLKTSGSEEYCGTVIRKAVQELTWNPNDSALKMIFIAGNEEFDQGNVKPQDAIKEALAKGITVNTIYCDNEGDSISSGWADGSRLGDGSFACIDHNQTKQIPETPYDKEIAQHNVELNDTYIAYGNKKDQGKFEDRQRQVDMFAGSMASPASLSERVIVKAKAQTGSAYSNAKWDMVDAVEQAEIAEVITDLRGKDHLPDALKGKTDEEIKQFVEKKSEERNKIQGKILELGKKREQWLQEQQKNSSEQSSLDDAILESIRKQAGKRKFTFEDK